MSAPLPLAGEGAAKRRVRVGRNSCRGILGLSMRTTRGVRSHAKTMRQGPTRAEDRMWAWLRDRRCVGYKFRRQHPIGPYILDFYCAELRLAIEVDGQQHYQAHLVEYENRRCAFLNTQGIEILRISNAELIRDAIGVSEMIDAVIRTRAASR